MPVGELQEQFAMIGAQIILMIEWQSFIEGTIKSKHFTKMYSNSIWINLVKVELNSKLDPSSVTQAVVDSLWMIKV